MYFPLRWSKQRSHLPDSTTPNTGVRLWSMSVMMFRFRGQPYSNAVWKSCGFFLLPNSTARSQTDKSRSHRTVEFWTTFKNNIWSYFVSLSFFLKSKSKAAGTYTAKNKEKHIARYSKKQGFCLRPRHYHDKRQLNHCYNGYFIWNYTDSPIVNRNIYIAQTHNHSPIRQLM